MDLFKNPIFGKGEALEQRLRRICTNCGQQIEHAAKKCVHCGHIPQEVKVQAARVCPNGHTMDPTWTHCPYCQDSGAPRITNEGTGPSRNRTRVQDDAADLNPERKTRIYDQPQEPAVAEYHGRIVGVLISYSRRREGEVFAIREGKNFIGSGNCVSTGLPCDVWFPEDKAMSSEHALILFRLGEFLIFDQQSTNGTFLNGKLVHFRGEELPHQADLKIGSTKFTFIKAETTHSAPKVETATEELRDEGERLRPR